MKKQLRKLQPPHPGSRFSMEEAIRAFRMARGSAPKPGTGYDEEEEHYLEEEPSVSPDREDAGLGESQARKQDIRAHGGDPAQGIRHVRNFLSSHAPGLLLPGADRIVARYRRFREDLPSTCAALHLDPGDLTFGDLTFLSLAFIRS